MEPLGDTARPDPAARIALSKRAGQPLKPAELARLRHAAQEFEAVFVEHMLKTMRQSFPQAGLFPSGAGQKLYQDLADQELARAMSRGGGLGLGDVLIRGLTRAEQKKPLSSLPTRPIGQGEASSSERGPE
jgi:flagellar protein FlgJ